MAAFLSRRDEASFRSLYRAHAPVLYGLAWRMLGGRGEDAEEAVQEAWIRAVVGIPAFRWQSSLRTWLSGITINCCREMRRRKRREETAPPPPADGSAGPAISADRATHPLARLEDERVDLQRAVGGLPDGYREVLVLHDIEGFTHQEIAGHLGIDIGTSKSQLSRARRALRARWEVGRGPAAGGEGAS